MADIKNIQVDGVDYAIKDEAARNSIGDLSKLSTEAKGDLVSALNELSAGAGSGSSPIQRIESLDESNLKNLRDLESGSYVLYGYFRPYAGAPNYLPFDNLLVNVFRVDEGSHLFEFSTANSEVNFIEILVNDTAEGGHTYSRTAINMLDLNKFAVQSDLSQNDPESPDYVKGRTHYEENSQTVIEWEGENGSVEGLDYFIHPGYGGDLKWYKLSDQPIIKDGVIPDYSFDVVMEGAVTHMPPDDVPADEADAMMKDAWEEHQGGWYWGDWILSVESEHTCGTDTETVHVGRGTYFAYYPTCDDYTEIYVRKLTYGSTVVHPLDEKFIPDSVARKTDVTWENLPDKPFCGILEQIVAETTIEFAENNPVAVGVIDAPLIKGDNYKVIWDGVSYDCVCESGGEDDGVEMLYVGNIVLGQEPTAQGGLPFCVVYGAGVTTVVYAQVEATAGHVPAFSRTLAIYRDSIKTIEEKFLPTAAAVPDAAGEAPTAAEFNALLAALRAAGYLAT